MQGSAGEFATLNKKGYCAGSQVWMNRLAKRHRDAHGRCCDQERELVMLGRNDFSLANK